MAAVFGSCSAFCIYKSMHFLTKVNIVLQMSHFQHKQMKWLVQGRVVSWWQGLEENPTDLTHFSNIPVIISLVLLSYSLYCFKSDLVLPSCCSWLWGYNFVVLHNGEKNEKGIFSSFFLPPVSLPITQKYWIFSNFGCRMEKAWCAAQEKWMLPRKWIPCRASQMSSPAAAVPAGKAAQIVFC